jgi:hypothetical protein
MWLTSKLSAAMKNLDSLSKTQKELIKYKPLFPFLNLHEPEKTITVIISTSKEKRKNKAIRSKHIHLQEKECCVVLCFVVSVVHRDGFSSLFLSYIHLPPSHTYN